MDYRQRLLRRCQVVYPLLFGPSKQTQRPVLAREFTLHHRATPRRLNYMNQTTSNNHLSDSLEDYLETIFELVRDHKFARVKEIAQAREVRSASVTPALRRLSDMGLITYEKREYIDLTPQGEIAARRIYARHRLLTRFLRDVLQMPQDMAQQDACAMEHSLSDNGVDHMVRFLEFLHSCPQGAGIIDRFRNCSLVNSDKRTCKGDCPGPDTTITGEDVIPKTVPLVTLKPGESGLVGRILGTGALRQRILDMGVMPGVELSVERLSPAGDPMWIRFHNSQLSLRLKEAEMVLVTRNE